MKNGLLLLGREVSGGRDVAAHDARELLAVGVDEARLADAGRIQPLEVAEVVRDLGDVAALTTDLLGACARLGEDVGERRRVGRRSTTDRARAK